MTEDDLAELKDHIFAVQNLLLSHIVATEVLLEGSAKATIDIARSQSASATRKGRSLVVLRLNALIDELDQCLDF